MKKELLLEFIGKQDFEIKIKRFLKAQGLTNILDFDIRTGNFNYRTGKLSYAVVFYDVFERNKKVYVGKLIDWTEFHSDKAKVDKLKKASLTSLNNRKEITIKFIDDLFNTFKENGISEISDKVSEVSRSIDSFIRDERIYVNLVFGNHQPDNTIIQMKADTEKLNALIRPAVRQSNTRMTEFLKTQFWDIHKNEYSEYSTIIVVPRRANYSEDFKELIEKESKLLKNQLSQIINDFKCISKVTISYSAEIQIFGEKNSVILVGFLAIIGLLGVVSCYKTYSLLKGGE